MWYYFLGMVTGGFIAFLLFCLLASRGMESGQEERLQAYKRGYRDALRKMRGIR